MSRHWAPLSAIIFAAVLAYVVGLRLSESAMAVVIGVMFGVAASIPTSIILILALRHTHGPRPTRPHQPPPPTIIVAPPGSKPSLARHVPWPAPDVYLPPIPDEDQEHTPRPFHIIGEEE